MTPESPDPAGNRGGGAPERPGGHSAPVSLPGDHVRSVGQLLSCWQTETTTIMPVVLPDSFLIPTRLGIDLRPHGRPTRCGSRDGLFGLRRPLV